MNIKIVNFEKQYLEEVISLTETLLPVGMENGESVRQSFEAIASWLDGELSEEEKAFIEDKEKVSFRYGLHYVVALDDNDNVVGVSGVYSVNKGYLEKLGFSGDSLLLNQLEDPANLWLGWTTIDKSLQGQGIGKRLINAALENAYTRLKDKGLLSRFLIVVADKGAIGFYKKLGMELEISEPINSVYSDDISGYKYLEI